MNAKKATQHDESTSTNEPHAPPVWVHEPDARDDDHPSHPPSGRDEGQGLDEPGYGYGV